MNNTVKNLKSLIKSTLEGDERLWFVNQDNEKEFNQTLLLDLVEKVDDTIISLLLQEEVLREKFFVKITPLAPKKQSTYIFKTNEFRFFMEENKVDNSYAGFKNRIGLTDGKKFLKDNSDIRLDWPYKDSVLEGGQSTEEGTDIEAIMNYELKNYELKKVKRKEIFFNQVLAQDEIDRLLDTKALVNWKRFDKNGKTPLLRGGDEVDGVDALKRDEDGTITENMIIKGNNLLALHTLKKQFRGKVKLIYIDPPYNTGNDGFKYNDNFNHSTWLTFMKNRLEVAREFLRDDGVIFVQCDDNEQAYLKILMDEVFGRENFVQTGVVNRASEIATSYTIQKHEYFLIFTKKIQQFKVDSVEKHTVSRGTVGNKDQTMPVITFPKSEYFLQRIIKISTNPGDIVLDYHLGSGTTAAVAHKMGRQYIGIEQMDYIETIAVERLKKVIAGEQGGISKAVNWQGGGDFIYFELAKWNQQAKEIIQAAESLETMIGFLDELSDKYFLNYNLKMQEFREKVILEPEFQALSLESQKAIFMAMLDNNQMYVNKSEMADEKFGISEEEQKLTEEFYN